MPNAADADELMVVSQLYTTYTIIIIFSLGLFGNLLNILVFINLKIFRLNRCAFYLIVESLVDIVQLSQLFANQMWGLSINGNDPTNVSLVCCKLRTVVGQWCRLMLSSIVCFTAIDQFLSTNPVGHLRRWSSLQIAHCQIRVSIFLCLVHTLPFAVFLQIRPPLGCIITNIGLTNYYSFFYYPVLNGLLPISISSLFSLLAYRNVRRIVRRQIPMDRRRLDQQLTAMIFVRIISYTILTLPYIIYRIYSLNVTINQTDLYRYAANQLISSVVGSLIPVNHAVIVLDLTKK
jgi:hypothetical protein